MSKFKIKNVTKLTDLDTKEVTELPFSDLTVQTETSLIQFEIDEKNENRSKFLIKAGSFKLIKTSAGMALEPFELRKYNLLKEIDNSSVIISEKEKFFSRLHVYEELKREPKRALLLCSPPGVGKSATITEVCNEALKDPNMTVIIWDTTGVNSVDVSSFFLGGSEFTPEVKGLILVIEDIEGESTEDQYRGRGAESSLLNLLDGNGRPFGGVPTFILATTNNPEKSVGALIDRPGRFDKVIELKTPSEKECKLLLAFIVNRELTEEEVEASKIASKAEFSIAHLQEMVVRSKLDDVSILEVANQLVAHKKRFAEGFSKVAKSKLGLGSLV